MDKNIYSFTGGYVRGSEWRRVIMAGAPGGWIKPPKSNKNTIKPNRGVAKGNREDVPPIPGKLEN